MFVNVRSATLSLGRWLLPELVVPSALACSAPADPARDPERAIVQTPGGRRISFAAAKPGDALAIYYYDPTVAERALVTVIVD